MIKASPKTRIFSVILLALFVMEYLEPSAVGIRAYVDVPITLEHTDLENSFVVHDLNLNNTAPFDVSPRTAFFSGESSCLSPLSIYFRIDRPPLK